MYAVCQAFTHAGERRGTMEKINTGTPYDDVFRTLMNDCTELIIPVVNEVFGEYYSGEEQITFLPNEHFMSRQGTDTKEKITDSCFEIHGRTRKRYHIECQSTADHSMVIRMFEYDSQIALDNGEIEENRLTVTFPGSAVIYLRHTRTTPDAMKVEINTPGGAITYEIPVLKTQKYTIDEIFDKKLLILIPFYIFTYESRFPEYEEDSEKLNELKKEYVQIRNRLEDLCKTGEISEYIKCTLVDMSNKVIEQIALKYAKVRKEVTSVMGGKILEYEAKTILQRGIQEGLQEGRIRSYVELVKDGLLPIEEAAKRLNMKEEELKKYLEA